MKKIFETINAYNAVSILSPIVSIFTFCWTYSIEEKTFKSDTYSLDLSYQVNISDKIDKKNILVFQKYIRISAKDYIKVFAKTGGISKFGIVVPQPYYENDFDIKIINTVGLYEESFQEAQYVSCSIADLVLLIGYEDDDNYYSSLILIIEDYKHNFFSNLIVFEFDKKDLTNINTRIYDKIHLFLTLNDIQSIPDFDLKQLKRYDTMSIAILEDVKKIS
ncbi:hypothetical protein [Schaedlerella arabinosiphila]|uniref:hypothetical protein n=1 Tax=Schaedlerella arabinosiphila TaxID=2044587 RepID=UPI0025580489|nr:hypothetical protein [Schaedlerella arabinosiphila]